MKNGIKLALLFLAFGLFTSCSLFLFDYNKCDEPEKFFGHNVRFEKYDSEKYFSRDSLRYSMYRFSFYEDSSFSYLQIYYQNAMEGIVIQDTTIMLNGRFKISKASGFPWYVIELNADYIYEKEIKDTLDGVLHFTNFSENEFTGFRWHYFTSNVDIFANTNSRGNLFYKDSLNNIDIIDSCFSLYVKSAVTAIDAHCAYEHKGCYYMLTKYQTFCLKQPEEVPEQNSTGDNL